MKLVSNRKLYRLGVLVALLMSVFLVHLVYHDIFHHAVDDVTRIKHSDKNFKPTEVYYRIEPNDLQSLSYQKTETFDKFIDWPFDHDISTSFDSRDTTTAATDVIVSFKENETLRDSVSLKAYNLKEMNKADIKRNNNNSDNVAHSMKPKNSLFNTNMHKLISGNIMSKSINSKPNQSLFVQKNKKQLLTRDKSKASSIHGPNSSDRKVPQNVTIGESKKSYFVFLCKSDQWCGGWGDRQRGITSAYHMSKLLGREFKIIMTTPCNLTKFYIPKNVDWVWKAGEKRPVHQVTLNAISKPQFRDAVVEGDFNQRYPHNVVFIKTNQDLIKAAEKNPLYAKRIIEDKSLLTKRSRFRSAWNDLMQPSEYILLKLQELVGASRLIRKGLISQSLKAKNNSYSSPLPSKPLICAHVRMGKNPTIPMDEQWDSFQPSDIPKLLLFLKSKDIHNDADFFLATDYEKLRGEFSNFFRDRLINNSGKIIHIDRQRHSPEACEGFGAAVLDQLVLSVCDVLITSRSGFSIHASYVSNSSNPTYVMEDSVIKLLKA